MLPLPPFGHRIGLFRFHPTGRGRHALLASPESHRAGLLPGQPGGIRNLTTTTKNANLIAQLTRGFEVHRGGGGFHLAAQGFDIHAAPTRQAATSAASVSAIQPPPSTRSPA